MKSSSPKTLCKVTATQLNWLRSCCFSALFGTLWYCWYSFTHRLSKMQEKCHRNASGILIFSASLQRNTGCLRAWITPRSLLEMARAWGEISRRRTMCLTCMQKLQRTTLQERSSTRNQHSGLIKMSSFWSFCQNHERRNELTLRKLQLVSYI